VNQSINKWFHCRVERPDAQVRLVCFPPAGAATSFFFGWAELLPPTVELHVCQLPGRERRLNEPLLTNLDELLPLVLQGIEAIADRELHLFGFSLGALIAFEVAHGLQLARPRVDHLLVASQSAPQRVENYELHLLDDFEFLRKLQLKYGDLPGAITSSAEIMQFYLRILRADISLLESFKFRDRPKLTLPVTAYAGMQDMSVSAESLDAWRDVTSGNFSASVFPGDHFFTAAQRSSFLRALSQDILTHHLEQ